MYARDKRDGQSKEGSGRVAIHKAIGLLHRSLGFFYWNFLFTLCLCEVKLLLLGPHQLYVRMQLQHRKKHERHPSCLPWQRPGDATSTTIIPSQIHSWSIWRGKKTGQKRTKNFPFSQSFPWLIVFVLLIVSDFDWFYLIWLILFYSLVYWALWDLPTNGKWVINKIYYYCCCDQRHLWTWTP